MTQPPDATELELIVKLRLIIARAANRDSLAWWDDEALTDSAGFILSRTFPNAPLQAARRLALEAAKIRHDAMCQRYLQPLHLFRLTPNNRDVQMLRTYALYKVDAPTEPIESIDALREQLHRVIGNPPPVRIIGKGNRGEIQIELESSKHKESTMVERAQALASIYLEAQPGNAVYPYVLHKPLEQR